MARNSQKNQSEEEQNAPAAETNENSGNDNPPPPDPTVDSDSGLDSEVVKATNEKVEESDVYSDPDDDEDAGETLGEAKVSEADIQKVLDQFGDKIPSSAIREEIVAELRGTGDSPTLRAAAGIGDDDEGESDEKSDDE